MANDFMSSNNLKPSEMKAFNTRDILVKLFKETVQNQSLPDGTTYPLAALDSKIAELHHVIEGYMSQGPQQQIESIKTLLGLAKDSARRKELIQNAVELDARLANLNTQGESLIEQARKIIAQFWDLVVKSNIQERPVSPEALSRIREQADDLNKRAEPFKQDEEALLVKINQTSLEVAKMTGKPVEEITASAQEHRP